MAGQRNAGWRGLISRPAEPLAGRQSGRNACSGSTADAHRTSIATRTTSATGRSRRITIGAVTAITTSWEVQDRVLSASRDRTIIVWQLTPNGANYVR